ncbi:ammonium transporter [Edaphobacter albus]|uniref:ammonium transporter n=1 Tax=Edaphobacter sp. 4G125 TaxID=2763071 RepID=UPI001648FFA2|nr:ammonium transporter [Edaphobacter sp. 4G125]QNI35978.1 ammonium transporter [Edaphobacter sp. 4G125]
MRVAVVKVSLALLLAIGVGGPMLAGQTVMAQTPGVAAPTTLSQTDRLDRVEKQTAENTTAIATAQTSGDNAWMLVSAAFVLMMSGPGLALFYGGLVRKKNVLGTMMQTFAMMAMVTVLWALLSYSLAFGEGNAFIGGFHHIFLHGVGLAPDLKYAPTIPAQTFMVYQLMFAIITPALITGAFAERMKFSSMLVFMFFWTLFIYSPMAHMVWGKGGLLNAALGGRIPCLDFAGGTVVHVTSGVSALVTAIYLGKRVGYPKEPMPPHSVVLSFIGACLLWVGWFGFNAGSALSAGTLATSAFVATHFAAAAAAVGWIAAEWIRQGKASALGAISGAVAGLVAITPAAGFVTPISGLWIGLFAGVFCYLMVVKVKVWFGYDDSLDAFGVHGAGGTLGAILTGIFANSSINPILGAGKATGLLEGNWRQLFNQIAGVAIAWTISIIGTLVILFAVDRLMGLRVNEDDERDGLDLSQHGEEGYDWAH